MDDDLKGLLSTAVSEIRSLRRQNEVLSAKVEVMDLFACVLHTSPATRSQGMAPDVAWLLEREISKMAEPVELDTDAGSGGRDG